LKLRGFGRGDPNGSPVSVKGDPLGSPLLNPKKQLYEVGCTQERGPFLIFERFLSGNIQMAAGSLQKHETDLVFFLQKMDQTPGKSGRSQRPEPELNSSTVFYRLFASFEFTPF